VKLQDVFTLRHPRASHLPAAFCVEVMDRYFFLSSQSSVLLICFVDDYIENDKICQGRL
jgi:hypothetical protein